MPAVRSFALMALAGLLLSSCGTSHRQSSADRSSRAVVRIQSGSTTASSAPAPDPAVAFAALERHFHARLGVYAIDTGSDRVVSYRADDRFAFASTGKALAAAAVLRECSAELNRVLSYGAAELQEHSPVTSAHVSTGMTIRDLLTASLEESDNTAANLLLAQLGGPPGLQRELRELGDSTTNVDRTEPTLNQAIPGDVRDTSTPRALGTDLRTFVLGSALTDPERQLLSTALVHNTTGDPYIRAGVPTGWTVGDRTGSADYGTRNDIAIAWPPSGAPVVISVLSDRGQVGAASDDALIANATSIAVEALR